GILIVSIFILMIFTLIYFGLSSSDVAIFGIFSWIDFYLLIFACFAFFNLVFHPINLLFRPKKVILAYKKFCVNQNIKDTDFTFFDSSLITYELNNSFSGIKNNLFKLTYYSLFNPDYQLTNKSKRFRCW
ncbi:MAG: hypothetical protein K2H11_02870, partial [Malacoplasma sp.]|nr:hypothetical protein [Malacoplasma sp.]